MHLSTITHVLMIGSAAAMTLRPSDSFQEKRLAPFTPPVIESVSFSGNGCPQDSTPKVQSSAWESFSFTIPSFLLSTTNVETRTANCQAHLNLGEGPPGWQVALRDVWSRGHVELAPGVSLTQYITVYYSQDAAKTATATLEVPSSPDSTVAKDITLHAVVPDASLVWSPCIGGDGAVGLVNVNFRMALTATDATAYGYYGKSKTTSVIERWGWVWRQC
ncbi:hypothetical protein F4778DRAFT_53119 [Xylariomycetidae sp. FL2044]|nr:hypothetical protein F4778DRAFT_53119 [Xylariomycetidae sp. FL2044]